MTNEQTREVMRLLFAAYTTQRMRMSDDDVKLMFQAYARGLADLEPAAVHDAVARLVLTEKWIPTIAEIRSSVVTANHGEPGNAIEQWGIVVQAMRRGRYADVGPFEDPITAQVVKDIGGLWQLGASELPAADRARFIEGYNQAQNAARRAAALSPGCVSRSLPSIAPAPQLTAGDSVDSSPTEG